MGFDAIKNAGKTTTIIEQLKGKSALVSELPEGEIYKSFNVWVGNGGYATSKNIENPVICFKVEKSWVQNKDIDQNSITLNWYSDDINWVQLPLKMLEEDSKYLYFVANTSGYSSFAITGKVKSIPEQQKDSDEQEDTISEISYKKTSDDTDGDISETDNKKPAPDFEAIFGTVCLLTVFYYTRKY